jgi:hypothetical protein
MQGRTVVGGAGEELAAAQRKGQLARDNLAQILDQIAHKQRARYVLKGQ